MEHLAYFIHFISDLMNEYWFIYSMLCAKTFKYVKQLENSGYICKPPEVFHMLFIELICLFI